MNIFFLNKNDTLLGVALFDIDMWQIDHTYVNECFDFNYVGLKRLLTSENSSMLLHKRLGHIS